MMSDRYRSLIYWAIVLGVGCGIGLGIAEFLWIDIQGIMPDYSPTQLLISWGLVALLAVVYFDLRERIDAA